jgi:predicted ATPase
VCWDEVMEQQTHLRHVKIDGFKSIKHFDLEMRPINILIGANGSGKTNTCLSRSRVFE